MTRTGELRLTKSGGRCGWHKAIAKVPAALVGLLALAMASSAAAEAYIESELAPRSIALGERTQYILTITNAADAEVTFPRFGDLKITSGPSQTVQSVMQFIGGRPKVQSTRVYRWVLEAPREGVFLISPATMVLEGRKHSSKALELNVGAPEPKPQWDEQEEDFVQDDEDLALDNRGNRHNPQSNQGRAGGRRQALNPFSQNFDPFAELFDDPFAGIFDDITAPPRQSDLFLRASTDKKEVYLGEQLSLSLHLFSQADISGVQALSFPKLDGFWAEDIEAPTQLYPERRTIRGKAYRAYMIRKRALFPLRAGEITIDPVEAQVNLALSMFFGAAADSVKRRSSPINVVVKPLPAQGQPQGFEASQVGSYRLRLEPVPSRLELGQPLELKLSVEGLGNIKNLKPPKLKLPDGLRAYSPTVSDQVRIERGRYGGVKTVEWVVIPERTGRFEIPALELAYFDPSHEEYRLATTQALSLEVTAPSRANAPLMDAQGPSEAEVANLLPSGLRPIRVNASLKSRQLKPVWEHSWFWPLTAAPVFLAALFGVGGATFSLLQRRNSEKNSPRKARGDAERRLKLVLEKAEPSSAAELYSEVARALLNFLQIRCLPGAMGMERQALVEGLMAGGFPSGPVRGLERLLERCDLARFSPESGDLTKLEDLVKEALWVVKALDDAASGRRRAS